MKSILLSIKPKYCKLIADGIKTIEVRKTMPKIITPFKCYMYCTKEHTNGDFILTKSEELNKLFGKNKCIAINKGFKTSEDIDLKGKVIGEFVCDKTQNLFSNSQFWIDEDVVNRTCLTNYEIRKYANGSDKIYGFYISDLLIYDKPKELNEFYRQDTSYDNSFGGYFEDRNKRAFITRPPQSWCYVENLEVEKC